MQTFLDDINNNIDRISKSLKEFANCASQAIENTEYQRKLLYQIKYAILANKTTSDAEKVVKLNELLAHECPHGTNGTT